MSLLLFCCSTVLACQLLVSGAVNGEALPKALDESFLDTLMRCQVSVHIIDVSSCFVW